MMPTLGAFKISPDQVGYLRTYWQNNTKLIQLWLSHAHDCLRKEVRYKEKSWMFQHIASFLKYIEMHNYDFNLFLVYDILPIWLNSFIYAIYSFGISLIHNRRNRTSAKVPSTITIQIIDQVAFCVWFARYYSFFQCSISAITKWTKLASFLPKYYS